jgi:hypothetical protein
VGLHRYERHHQPLLSRRQFLQRLLGHFGFSSGIVAVSLLMGTVGYHVFEGLAWIDALLNAAMLLGGMGPVSPIQSTAGKLFASFYALYSGLIFLVVASILVAPLFHRLFHHFHLEIEDESPSEEPAPTEGTDRTP